MNIHRSNVMWFVPANLKEWGVNPPKTWDEFLSTCADAQGQGRGVPRWRWARTGPSTTCGSRWPSACSARTSGPACGPASSELTDAKVVKAWETFGKVLDCTNADASGLSWQQATDRVLKGDAAFNIMGDWAAGYMSTTLKLTPGEGFGWAPSPGTGGTFMMLSDSFGLPKGIKHRAAAVNWLKLLGSKEGQDIFNPLKGSIAARLDSDLSKYNAYSSPPPRTGRPTRSWAAWCTAPSRRRASAASSARSWRSTCRRQERRRRRPTRRGPSPTR